MRYKVINNKRLNVYLTKVDLQKENVTIEEIVGGNEKSVIKIKQIFKVVSKLAHFDVNNRLLNIVLMPIEDGDLIISAGIAEEYDVKEAVFMFENFEDLLGACFSVGAGGVSSSLYLLEGKYYLTICNSVLSIELFENMCAIFSEYGEKTECSTLIVAEHGKILAKKMAIEKMLRAFF